MGNKEINRERHIQLLNHMNKKYASHFIENKNQAIIDQKIFLEGIIIGIAGSYVVSYVLNFSLRNIYLEIISFFLLIILTLILIYFIFRSIYYANRIRQESRLLKEVYNLDFNRLIQIIDKEKGAKYADKMLPVIVKNMYEQMERKGVKV